MKRVVSIVCFLLLSIFTLRAFIFGIPIAKDQGLFPTWDDIIEQVVAIQPPSVQDYAVDEELVFYFSENLKNYVNAQIVIVEDEEYRVYVVHDIYGRDWDPINAKGEVTIITDFSGQVRYYVDTLIYWDHEDGWLVEFTQYFQWIVQVVRFALNMVLSVIKMPFEYLFYYFALVRRIVFNTTGYEPPV